MILARISGVLRLETFGTFFRIAGALLLFVVTSSCDIGFPELKLPEVGGEKYFSLTPVGACTEMACGSENPCCNSCSFEGWEVQTPDGSLPAAGQLPPACRLDGCGKCPGQVLYEGRGEAANGRFQVAGFRQVKTGPSVQVVLTAHMACTLIGCPPENPNCNTCSFSGWALPDQYSTADRYASGDLPTCEEIGGCENKRLQATGKFAGRQFIVERWQEVGEPGAGDENPVPGNGNTQEYLLQPGVQCTKMNCSSENPCCNSCLAWGWVVNDPGTGQMVPALGELPPNCRVDGCGECQGGNHFRAEGDISGGKLRVTRWWDTREQE